jgi:MFS family permease
MDELELLKKDWKANSTRTDQQITKEAIYPMMHKKSSSIVKTLFYISIAELIIWLGLNVYPFFASNEWREELTEMYGNNNILVAFTFINCAVIMLFVILLYKSYKSISVTDNAKKLIENILKTRKIIKYYVIFSLAFAFVSMIVGFYFTVFEIPEYKAQFEHISDKQMLITMVIGMLIIALFLVAFWLIYRLIYGILLKRLHRNYKELKKLEV